MDALMMIKRFLIAACLVALLSSPASAFKALSGASSGSSPGGAAGGVLSGTYPNPTLSATGLTGYLGAVGITGNIGNGTDFIKNLCVNGVCPVTAFNASGSANQYTCSITGSSQTLTCTGATDFVVGQYVAVPTAGIASPLGTPVAPVITNIGTTGAVNDCYTIIAKDSAGGLSAQSASACNATGPAAGAFSAASALNVAFTTLVASANTSYGICRSIAGGASTFIGSATGTPYKDYGDGTTKTFGWPATCGGARNQTAFGRVTAGSGTTWTLDFTLSQGQASAPNTATSVTVSHDDTIAVQLAYDTVAAGSAIYFPSGTYRLNMIQILNSSAPYARTGYVMGAGQINLNAAGSIQVNGNRIESYGDGQGKTFLQRDEDWIGSNVRGVLFNTTPASWGGYVGPISIAPAYLLTAYPINAATRYNYCVTLTTAGNAANFSPGDLVYLSGGQGVNAGYTVTNITKITTSDSSTGVVCLADGLTTDLPFGSGLAASIENLTTNSVAQEQINFRDLTMSTPGVSFNFTDLYNSYLDRINAPERSPHATQEVIQNEWSSRIAVRNSTLTSSYQESPLGAYWTWTNNKINLWRSISTFNFNGGTSPLMATGNTYTLGCGSSVTLENTIVEASFQNNMVYGVCPTGSSAQDLGAFTLGTTLTGGQGYDWNISNNTFNVTNRAGMNLSNSTRPLPYNTTIANNDWTWNSGTQTGSAWQLSGGVNFHDNSLVSTETTTRTATAIEIVPTATFPGMKILNNSVVSVGGAQDLVCMRVQDPGSVVRYNILINGNFCDNTNYGLFVTSGTNTPDIVYGTNSYRNINTTAHILTANMAYAGLHGNTPPTLTSCGTGALSTGSSSDGGKLTSTGATSCILTFGTDIPWTAQPNCRAADSTTLAAVISVAYTGSTAITISGQIAGDVVGYTCTGN